MVFFMLFLFLKIKEKTLVEFFSEIQSKHWKPSIYIDYVVSKRNILPFQKYQDKEKLIIMFVRKA